jgi:hypothetical protein
MLLEYCLLVLPGAKTLLTCAPGSTPTAFLCSREQKNCFFCSPEQTGTFVSTPGSTSKQYLCPREHK